MEATSNNKRVVFVSLIGTYQTWENVPPHVLYPALIILPLKRKWLNHPDQYCDELKSHFAGEITIFQSGMTI